MGNAYNIKFSKEEREEYDQLTEKYGFKSLSQLIRWSLHTVKENNRSLDQINKKIDDIKEILKQKASTGIKFPVKSEKERDGKIEELERKLKREAEIKGGLIIKNRKLQEELDKDK